MADPPHSWTINPKHHRAKMLWTTLIVTSLVACKAKESGAPRDPVEVSRCDLFNETVTATQALDDWPGNVEQMLSSVSGSSCQWGNYGSYTVVAHPVEGEIRHYNRTARVSNGIVCPRVLSVHLRIDFEGDAIAGPVLYHGAIREDEDGGHQISASMTEVYLDAFDGKVLEQGVDRLELGVQFEGSLWEPDGVWIIDSMIWPSTGDYRVDRLTCNI